MNKLQRSRRCVGCEDLVSVRGCEHGEVADGAEEGSICDGSGNHELREGCNFGDIRLGLQADWFPLFLSLFELVANFWRERLN